MSQLELPKPGLLLTSFLYRQDLISEEQLKDLWQQKYGDFFFFFQPFCSMKNYYAQEMGGVEHLRRFFLLSQKTFTREELVSSKLWAIQQEQDLSIKGCRVVNIDPGFLSQENFLLATGKNFSHRVHLQEGIYANLELYFHQGHFQTLPWTYPDYARAEMREFLTWGRYYLQLIN